MLDARLGLCEYLDGNGYSVADIATWPWVQAAKVFDIDEGQYTHVTRWVEQVGARPAVQRAMAWFNQPRPAL